MATEVLSTETHLWYSDVQRLIFSFNPIYFVCVSAYIYGGQEVLLGVILFYYVSPRNWNQNVAFFPPHPPFLFFLRF